ncbi:hypothetical protein Glove_264g78 [Diversispora epigaea]|uniref:HAT C-terminal dimerisation domain-containing protein n=1 Tax=Diversispora epigaea TaxID=1348612 RepID=A0A397I9L0_9GLOM|nr:hypothetical protein Glove_264g78 [Diversispora epigaea]
MRQITVHSQFRKYLNQSKPYNAAYSPKYNTPYLWWNSIFDGKSSLSKLTKILFAIVPHSASCERLFSILIQKMLEVVFEEAKEDENLLNEEDEILTELMQNNQIVIDNENLIIENIINLGPWVYIDNSDFLNVIDVDNSDDEEDWDPENIGNNNYSDNEN